MIDTLSGLPPLSVGQPPLFIPRQQAVFHAHP